MILPRFCLTLAIRPYNAWSLRLLLALAVLSAGGSLWAQAPVRIALLPAAHPHDGQLRLADIANITGGPLPVRQAIGQLDLVMPARGQASTISRAETLARLLIAGYDESDFLLTGESEIRIAAADSRDRATLIRESIGQHVARSLQLSPDDILVELDASSLQKIDWSRFGVTAIRVEPLEHGDRIPGRKLVQLGIFDGTRLLEKVQVLAATSIRRQVLVASRPIDRGEQLEPSNTLVEFRQFSSAAAGQYLTAADLGQTTSRRLNAHQIIRPTDVRRSATTGTQSAVRSRDLVTVTARRGSLKITLSGAQAMRSGRIGDLIPLKNLSSGKVIYGRVVGPGHVELGQ